MRVLRKYLDHGLAQDMSEGFTLEASGSKTGGYNANDPAPKLAGSAKIRSSPENRGHCSSRS